MAMLLNALRTRLQDCRLAQGSLIVSRLGYSRFEAPHHRIIHQRLGWALWTLSIEAAVLNFVLSILPTRRTNARSHR